MSFQKITVDTLVNNRSFFEYLKEAQIKKGNRGGTFVGNYEIAPSEFRKYGIILSKGGMILPQIEPEELRQLMMAEYNENKEIDEEIRLEKKEEFLAKVFKLLRGYKNLDDLTVQVTDNFSDNDEFRGSGKKKVQAFFTREGENLLEIWSEVGPSYRKAYNNRYTWIDWDVYEMPMEYVKEFLDEEERLAPLRKLFADRLTKLIEMSYEVGQKAIGEDGWDRPRVELFLYDDYSQDTDWGYFGKRCNNIFSAHRIMYRKKLYQFTEQDISALEKEVKKRSIQAQARRKKLLELFKRANGVFTKTQRERSCHAGTSLATGRAKWDEWTEITYFIGGEEVTDEEYEWLNNCLDTIPIPEGFYRESDGLNTLVRVIPYQSEKDTLEVYGRIGKSCRRIIPEGYIYKGNPAKYHENKTSGCTEPWNAKLILGNGREVEVYVHKHFSNDELELFKHWNDPEVQAYFTAYPLRSLDVNYVSDVLDCLRWLKGGECHPDSLSRFERVKKILDVLKD